jgi:predicted DNA-binding helix-hairpin-helix protein
MGRQEKLALLARAAQYDLACACGGAQTRSLGSDGKWIYPVALPNGGTLPVLKVLQSSGCERNCRYCAERSGGRHGRAGFTPDELAETFMEMAGAGLVKGLFLSSAIQGTPVATMDRMIATMERIRLKYRFGGFVHAKVIPGAEEAQIVRAMQLADRVSVNLEAPTAARLSDIAPGKQYHRHLLGAMDVIAKHLGRPDLRSKSHTTQYVVGAAGEQDQEILTSLWNSYRTLRLGRGYFSAFQPVDDTPFAEQPPAPAMREHRLYQADFLFRKYGFALDELVFDTTGNLSLESDPKAIWAAQHPERFPLEINQASRAMLLRVPGIGPTAVSRILSLRQESKIRDLDGLKAATPRWRAAAPYLLFDGKHRLTGGRQLTLPF